MFSPLGQHARYHPNAMFCDRERHRLAVARSFDTYTSMLDNPTLNVELRPHEGRVVVRIELAPRFAQGRHIFSTSDEHFVGPGRIHDRRHSIGATGRRPTRSDTHELCHQNAFRRPQLGCSQ